MKKIGGIILITVLVSGLTIASLVDDDCIRSCDTTDYSYCNATTNSSKVNEMLTILRDKANDDIIDEIEKVCEEINVSHYTYIFMYCLTCVAIP